ncbi:DUF4340 domain-containing protein [Pseudomarimonas arenosa]|uniref:DUF4340 domain-containing protein n=1 Tax=Pseudomarimonas arenosa TaxID=2774145 RepID=A0AAW3ZHS8_9GAMM|nr:DUF4340 domain-containing protein [Pseudomarimonas arenosa]MBD8524682.1 DUF4340 domain-containing protein [Pseudomarimonas arenosa]
MKPRILIGLLVAAVLVICLALWLDAGRKPAAELSMTGPALPGLLERLESIEEVRITRAGDARVATLKRVDGGWQLEEKSYPADADALRRVLLNIAQAKRLEAKTSNPELYSKLGVSDVSKEDAAGVQLELLGGGEPMALIVGSNYSQGTGTYVRTPGEAQSWLIGSNVAVETKTNNWLKKDLLDVQPNRVARVEVTADKDKVEIGRNEDGDFRVLNLPKGREASSDFVADATAGLLQGLRIDDVGAAKADAAVERSAKFELIDGITVELSAHMLENQTWVSLSAALNEEQAVQHISAEQAKQTEAWQAEQTAKAEDEQAAAADGSAEAETGASEAEPVANASDAAVGDAGSAQAPLAVTDPEADRDAKLQALRDEVAAWQALFQGRVFQLPSFKAANLNRKLEDYLKPKE